MGAGPGWPIGFERAKPFTERSILYFPMNETNPDSTGPQPNPFAAPTGPSAARVPYAAGFGSGVWRDGKSLVMHRDARLPPLCVRTGVPVDEQGVAVKLSWHHPLLALSFLAGCLIYVILAIVVTKKATIAIPLSPDERRKRKTAIYLCTALGLLGVFGFFASFVLITDASTEATGLVALLASVFVGIGAAVVGTSRSRILRPVKITDSHLWLRGVHASILDELPALPPAQ